MFFPIFAGHSCRTKGTEIYMDFTLMEEWVSSAATIRHHVDKGDSTPGDFTIIVLCHSRLSVREKYPWTDAGKGIKEKWWVQFSIFLLNRIVLHVYLFQSIYTPGFRSGQSKNDNCKILGMLFFNRDHNILRLQAQLYLQMQVQDV